MPLKLKKEAPPGKVGEILEEVAKFPAVWMPVSVKGKVPVGEEMLLVRELRCRVRRLLFLRAGSRSSGAIAVIPPEALDLRLVRNDRCRSAS
jgi:hypothetical protein